MPNLSSGAKASAPQAELHPEGLRGYHQADPMHPLATKAANSLLCCKDPSMSQLWCASFALPCPPQMHAYYYSLHVWNTLGPSSRCSCSLLMSFLPLSKPLFTPHSPPHSTICRICKVIASSLHGTEAAVFFLGSEDFSIHPASSCLAVEATELRMLFTLLWISVEKALLFC